MISWVIAIAMKSQTQNFDPIKTVRQIQSQDRRDDAIDLVKFLQESGSGNNLELNALEKDLEYTIQERFKSAIWNGMTKGEVYDYFSGLGATTADMCLWGDVKDLGIQAYKYIYGESGHDNLVGHPNQGTLHVSSQTMLDKGDQSSVVSSTVYFEPH
jgi:hypothetical protein